jgi:hypothetical protein
MSRALSQWHLTINLMTVSIIQVWHIWKPREKKRGSLLSLVVCCTRKFALETVRFGIPTYLKIEVLRSLLTVFFFACNSRWEDTYRQLALRMPLCWHSHRRHRIRLVLQAGRVSLSKLPCLPIYTLSCSLPEYFVKANDICTESSHPRMD